MYVETKAYCTLCVHNVGHDLAELVYKFLFPKTLFSMREHAPNGWVRLNVLFANIPVQVYVSIRHMWSYHVVIGLGLKIDFWAGGKISPSQ